MQTVETNRKAMGYSSSTWDREPTPKITLAHLMELNRDQRQPYAVESSIREQGPTLGFSDVRPQCNEQKDGARRKLLEVLNQALAILGEECDDEDDEE
jgi:hypothetical protein